MQGKPPDLLPNTFGDNHFALLFGLLLLGFDVDFGGNDVFEPPALEEDGRSDRLFAGNSGQEKELIGLHIVGVFEFSGSGQVALEIVDVDDAVDFF